MFYYVVACLGLLSLFLYWGYKKMREAPYKPGMVAELAKLDDFDEAELYKESSKDKWRLPGDIDIFFFPPTLTSAKHSPVLAVHGGPSIAPKETWKVLADNIENLYLYHARGCGHSTRPLANFPTPGKMWPGIKLLEEQLGIATQVADMERIRRRLGAEKLDLVGHSFGGFMATLYAAEFPQHVRSLTLLVPAAVLVLPSKEDGNLFTMVEAKLKERGVPGQLEAFQAFMKRYLDFGSLPNETDESLAHRQAEFAKHYYRAVEGVDEPKKPIDLKMIGGMACYATFCSMGMEHDYIPALKERMAGTNFPVSIVHGANDFIPASTSRKYVDLFPAGQVEFHTVKEGDHELFCFEEVGYIVENTIRLASRGT